MASPAVALTYPSSVSLNNSASLTRSTSSCLGFHFTVSRYENEASRLFESARIPSFGKRLRKRPRHRGVLCMATDYYKVLGISKSASKQDIKGAYRRLARQYHPDINKEPGAEERFKEISAAYEVLSDDEKRSMYDRFGEVGVNGAAAGNGTEAYATNPFDLFDTIFGSGMSGFSGMGGMGASAFRMNRQGMSVPGEELRYDMTLEFKEAVFGAEKAFELSHLEVCYACNGTGAMSRNSQKVCPACGGQGQVMQTRQTAFGQFSQVSLCSTCGGEGEIITSYCKKCGGEGRVKVKKIIRVKVPAGVSNGSTLRVRGEGHAGVRGGPPGDLYVFLNIKEEPDIQRDGINLYSSVSINYTDAILGVRIKVKAIDGNTGLHIPAGTQPGNVLVLSRKGVPKLDKPTIRGDHFFTVKVSIPTRLSEVERKLVEELATFYSKGAKAVGETTSDINATKSQSGTDTSDGKGLWSFIKKVAGRRSGDSFGCLTAQAFTSQQHSFSLSNLPHSTNNLAYSLATLKFMVLVHIVVCCWQCWAPPMCVHIRKKR